VPGVRANQALVQRQSALVKAGFIVPYLTTEGVSQMVEATSASRHGDRDGLLIRLLFGTGLRKVEAQSVTLATPVAGRGPALPIIGKGRKPRQVAYPRPLAESLQAYAYRHHLAVSDPVFPINRKRGHQIVTKAGEVAGLQKKVYPHLLWHNDAIERLGQTVNPKALHPPGPHLALYDYALPLLPHRRGRPAHPVAVGVLPVEGIALNRQLCIMMPQYTVASFSTR
jgi:hypothetical protein